MMKILIAPDSFKGSLTALQAARAIREGLMASKLMADYQIFPIADGGEGSLDVILTHIPGERKQINTEDALGRPVRGDYGLINNGRTAVIELAKASGIQLLNTGELDPMTASTYGTGLLIADALRQDVEEIILAIGGSATVDGGAGILEALGVPLLSSSGHAIARGGGGLSGLSGLGEIPSAILEKEITILCDVENPLLGKEGAAAVFAPQKGATSAEIKILEEGLSHFNDIIKKKTGRDLSGVKHGGASGGVAAGLHGILDAKLVPGLDYILKLAGIDNVLEKTSIVITGEGRFDGQSIKGKGPWGLAKKARQFDIPVILLAGQVEGRCYEWTSGVIDAVMAVGTDGEAKEDLTNAAEALTAMARWAGNILAMGTLQ